MYLAYVRCVSGTDCNLGGTVFLVLVLGQSNNEVLSFTISVKDQIDIDGKEN